MTSPEDSPIFTTGTIYTQSAPSGNLWGKVAGGLGNILGGLGAYAREALPYIAQAASTYGDALRTTNSSQVTQASDNDNSLTYQPSSVNLATVAPIPVTPISIPLPKPVVPLRIQTLNDVTQQLASGINPIRETRINVLNALTQGANLSTHSQPSVATAQASPIQASKGSLLPPQIQPASVNEPLKIKEQPYSIQGAQKPRSYESFYREPDNSSIQDNTLASSSSIVHSQFMSQYAPYQNQRPPQSTNQVSKIESRTSSISMSSVWEKINSRLVPTDGELKKLFHSIDLEQYTAKTSQVRQYVDNLRQFVEEKLARNIVDNAERDSQGNVLLQGIPTRLADAVFFAMQDIQHFQNTDVHLSPYQLIAMREKYDGDTNANTAYGFIEHSSHANDKSPLVQIEKIQHKLVFDGQHLADYQYVNGKLIRKIAYPATSGVLGSTDPKQPNHGPIPAGKYYLDTRNISYNPLRAVTNRFLGDWGLYRVPLTPSSKTNTFGRKDFYIHGGDKPGSAGCIDIGHNDANLLAALKAISGIIEVIVRYPNDRH